MGGVGGLLVIEVGNMVWEWRLGGEFGGGLVVLDTGQQRSEGGESKQEGEDRRPTDSRKEEAPRARGLRHGGLTPLPAVAQHSLPPSPQGWGRVIDLARGEGLAIWLVWAVFGLEMDVVLGRGLRGGYRVDGGGLGGIRTNPG